jgi:hypothetical protein
LVRSRPRIGGGFFIYAPLFFMFVPFVVDEVKCWNHKGHEGTQRRLFVIHHWENQSSKSSGQECPLYT